MLKVDHIYKTFNPGTINEKTALNGTCLLYTSDAADD